MSDKTQQVEAPPQPGEPYRPTILIFLIMPVFAALVALVITNSPGGSNTADNAQLTPPAVAYTPFSLIDKPAPDFALTSLSGDTIRLSAYRGKWVLVNFWATWCGPCRSEMPLLQDLIDGKFEQARAVPEGLSVLSINRNEAPDVIKGFMSELNLKLTVVLDPEARVNNRYGVVQLPISYFIDPQGIVRERIIGEIKPDLLEKTLAKLSKQSG
jgi:peroxiredoxin